MQNGNFNPAQSLDAIIASKLGEMMIINTKQSVLIDVLKAELAKRDAEISRLKSAEPELPINPVSASHPSEARNGKSH